MDWNISALHIGKLSFKLFFGWINQHFGFIIKNKLAHFNKCHHIALANPMCVEFDELILVPKLNSEYGFVFLRHGLKLSDS